MITVYIVSLTFHEFRDLTFDHENSECGYEINSARSYRALEDNEHLHVRACCICIPTFSANGSRRLVVRTRKSLSYEGRADGLKALAE